MAKYKVTWNYDNQLVKKGKAHMVVADADNQREAIKLAKRRSSLTRKYQHCYNYKAKRL